MKNSETIHLKNGKKIILRHVKRSDVNSVWNNFNEVIDEGIYLPTFEKVLSSYEKSSWYQDLITFNNMCLVAEDPDIKGPDKVIGQCTIEDIQWEASQHVAVLGVIIKSEYRKLGLGKKLMKFSFREAELNGKKKIILSTFSTNEYAIKLYEKLGFEKVGLRKKHFLMDGHYIDEVLMEVWLDETE